MEKEGIVEAITGSNEPHEEWDAITSNCGGQGMVSIVE